MEKERLKRIEEHIIEPLSTGRSFQWAYSEEEDGFFLPQ